MKEDRFAIVNFSLETISNDSNTYFTEDMKISDVFIV